MAKWRALHASITTDGKVNRLTEFGQLLYDRMMVKADDWGIITGDTFELKGETIPLSSRTFEEMSDALQEMTDQSLIWQYEPEGVGPLVQIRKFDDHQPGALIRKRTAPKLPLHPDWRPIIGDTRSITLLQEVVPIIPATGDIVQEVIGNDSLDKTRVDKNRQEDIGKAKTRKRDPHLDHWAIKCYRHVARKHIEIALRDDWVAFADEAYQQPDDEQKFEAMKADLKGFIAKGWYKGNVAWFMEWVRDGKPEKWAGGESGKDRRCDQGPTGTDDKQYLRDALREKS